MFGKNPKYYKANAGFDETVIGEKAYFYGSIEALKMVRIDGVYQGPVLKADVISIGKLGTVKTNIYAGTVIIEGTLLGDVTATTRVMLMPNSKLVGNVSAPEMITSKGVLFEGVCRIAKDLETDISKDIRNIFKNIPQTPEAIESKSLV